MYVPHTLQLKVVMVQIISSVPSVSGTHTQASNIVDEDSFASKGLVGQVQGEDESVSTCSTASLWRISKTSLLGEDGERTAAMIHNRLIQHRETVRYSNLRGSGTRRNQEGPGHPTA